MGFKTGPISGLIVFTKIIIQVAHFSIHCLTVTLLLLCVGIPQEETC
jgi:hypothetical protein